MNNQDSSFSEVYKDILQTVELVFEHYVKSREAMIKNLLNLSAGSLVATITLIQVFGNTFSTGLILLPISWFLFGCSIIACFIHIGNSENYFYFIEIIRSFESTAEEVFSKVESDASEWDKVKFSISFLEKSLENDARFTRLWTSTIVALMSFIGGLTCLGIFASLNLPW